MKNTFLFLFYLLLFSSSINAQVCDSRVPTFNIDFTGTAAGSTWSSPDTSRLGYCCTASGIERCIDFVINTDSNTMAFLFSFYTPIPGSLYYQVDCSPSIPIPDTAYINT